MEDESASLVFQVVGDQARLMREPRKVMTSEVLRVGRRDDNDWVFPQPYVSRFQLVMRCIGGLSLIQQVGSCPVAVNDRTRPLASQDIRAVGPGDRIFLDDIEIRVEGLAATDPVVPTTPSVEALPEVTPCEPAVDILSVLPPMPEPETQRSAPTGRRQRLATRWFADGLDGGGIEGTENPRAVPESEPAPAGTLSDMLEGAGCVSGVSAISAEAARELGVILRVCLDGLVLMLMARNQIRHELHIARTQVHVAANPLKSARDGASAWEGLLCCSQKGDGLASAAVKEAFEDIRYHELALLSAQRAAFDHVIDTFHPDSLRGELQGDGGTGSFLSTLDRGQLWRLYVQRYGALLSDADHAYRILFREPIAHAYEQTVQELRQLADRRRGRAEGA